MPVRRIYFNSFILAVVTLTFSSLLLSGCGTASTPTAAVPQPTVATAPTTSAVVPVVAPKTVAPVATGNHTGVTDSEIKLGVSAPLSGSTSFLGVPIRVIDAYFKMINDQGGIYGRKIKYIIKDDSFDPAKSQAFAKSLIDEDQVFALVGMRSPIVPQVRDYLVQQKMPTLPFITSSSLLYEPSQKLIFGFLPPLGPEARFVADYATDQLGAKKLTILYQSDSIGRDAVTPFVTEVQTKGASVATQVSVTTTTSAQDLSGVFAKLQQSQSDFLYVAVGNIPAVISLLKQLGDMPNKPRIMLSYYVGDPSIYPTLDKAAEGIYSSWFALPPDSNDLKSVQFREFMHKYLPSDPIGYYAQEGYIIGQVVVEALKRAGQDLSRESLVAAAESIIDWRESYANTITYGPLNRSPINSFYVTQYRNGKVEKVSDWYTVK